MKNWLWPEADKRLSVVPRWAIVNTIQKQTVSDHCFRVVRLIHRIGDNVGVSPDAITVAMTRAIYHDDDEHVSGDVPSIAKKYLDTERLKQDFPAPMSSWQPSGTVAHLIKVADKVEAILFLRTEIALGNKTVGKILDHVCGALYDYCQRNLLMEWYFAIEQQMQSLDLAVDPLEK